MRRPVPCVFTEEVDGPIGDPRVHMMLDGNATGLRLHHQEIAEALGEAGANLVCAQVAEIVIVDVVVDAFFHRLQVLKSIVSPSKVHLAEALRPVTFAEERAHHRGQFGNRSGQ